MGGPISGPTRALIPGRTRSSAATACRQNLAGSLSPGSSDSHATRRGPASAQSASRTVLPYPAGAQTRTIPWAQPGFELSGQAGAGHQAGPRARQVQLGGQ